MLNSCSFAFPFKQGSEWAPPQKGWFDRDRKMKEMRLSKVDMTDADLAPPGKRIVGGIEYDAQEFLPQDMQD